MGAITGLAWNQVPGKFPGINSSFYVACPRLSFMDGSKPILTSQEFLNLPNLTPAQEQGDTCDRAKRSQLQHSFLCMSGTCPGAGTVGREGTQDPAVMNPVAMNNRRCSFLPCRLAFLPKSSSDQLESECSASLQLLWGREEMKPNFSSSKF